LCIIFILFWLRGAERIWPPSGETRSAEGARRSVAVPNGEGVASGSATRVLNETCNKKPKKENGSFKKSSHAKHATHLCCAARGHALAVFYLLAPPPSLRSGSARSKNSLRPAQHVNLANYF